MKIILNLIELQLFIKKIYQKEKKKKKLLIEDENEIRKIEHNDIAAYNQAEE